MNRHWISRRPAENPHERNGTPTKVVRDAYWGQAPPQDTYWARARRTVPALSDHTVLVLWALGCLILALAARTWLT